MPEGKPAGIRCIQLTADNRCGVFGRPDRPLVCLSLKPSEEMCGTTAADASRYLEWLEEYTSAPQK